MNFSPRNIVYLSIKKNFSAYQYSFVVFVILVMLAYCCRAEFHFLALCMKDFLYCRYVIVLVDMIVCVSYISLLWECYIKINLNSMAITSLFTVLKHWPWNYLPTKYFPVSSCFSLHANFCNSNFSRKFSILSVFHMLCLVFFYSWIITLVLL